MESKDELKKVEQLQDGDLMPWGKFKGYRMDEVHASYFHWLWTNKKDPMSRRTKTDPVASYIERNLSSLEKGHPDGIWREK